MKETPKPLSKAETRKLQKEAAQVGKGKQAPIDVQHGAQINYHELLKCGFGAILQPSPSNNKTHMLHVFSFKVTGIKCEITSCTSAEVLLHQVEDYAEGSRTGSETEPTQEIRDCIEEYLQTKFSIGITF